MQDDLQNFIHNIGKLKRKKREGWVRKGIKNPESVAEHCFRSGIMAYVLAPQFNLNADRCLKMALFHDICEYKVPDYTPADNIDKNQKRKEETEAMQELTVDLKNSDLMDVWNEYENQLSPEAKFTKAVEALEMYFQVLEYNEEQPNVNLEEFWQNSKLYDFNVLKDLFEQLKKNRL